MKTRSLALALLCLGSSAQADLVIHAAELGIGKFHRKDHAVHPYDLTNVWRPYVLAQDAPLTTPQVLDNADRSVTIYFSHLEELLQTVVRVAREKGETVAIFNLEAHGMPGGMWFPKDGAEMVSRDCSSWRASAEAADDENYNQYYSGVSAADIRQFRAISNFPNGHYSCVTGRDEFREIARRIPDLQASFSSDAQVHLVSCLVGLGARGDAFTKALAQIFLSDAEGRVHSSLNFGLGDWSMPEGMGFWDYQNDAQLARDNEVYQREKRDRAIAQRGTMRVAQVIGGQAISGLIENIEYMLLDKDTRPYRRTVAETLSALGHLPTQVRIPGTAASASLVP